MRHYYCYAILFPKRDLRTGVFSTERDLFAGMTEENCYSALLQLCETAGYGFSQLKNYTLRALGEPTMRDIYEEGVVRGFGNVGSGPQDQSDVGGGDGRVPGWEDPGE